MRSRTREQDRRWWQTKPTTSAPTFTTTAVILPEMTLDVDVRGPVVASFSGEFSHNTVGTNTFAYVAIWLYVDGVKADAYLGGDCLRETQGAAVAAGPVTVSFAHILTLSPGPHNLAVYGATGTGTVTCNTLRRILTAWEL